MIELGNKCRIGFAHADLKSVSGFAPTEFFTNIRDGR